MCTTRCDHRKRQPHAPAPRPRAGEFVRAATGTQVLAYHNLTAADNIPAPTQGVLVTYNLATPYAQSAWHYWTDATHASTLVTALESIGIYAAARVACMSSTRCMHEQHALHERSSTRCLHAAF